jgi:hypothetical protein
MDHAVAPVEAYLQINGYFTVAEYPTTSLLLAISFILCVVFDLLFPSYAMYESWQALVPGFVWISWKIFLSAH